MMKEMGISLIVAKRVVSHRSFGEKPRADFVYSFSESTFIDRLYWLIILNNKPKKKKIAITVNKQSLSENHTVLFKL